MEDTIPETQLLLISCLKKTRGQETLKQPLKSSLLGTEQGDHGAEGKGKISSAHIHSYRTKLFISQRMRASWLRQGNLHEQSSSVGLVTGLGAFKNLRLSCLFLGLK